PSYDIKLSVKNSAGDAYIGEFVTIYTDDEDSRYLGSKILYNEGEINLSFKSEGLGGKEEIRVVVNGNSPSNLTREQSFEVHPGTNELAMTMDLIPEGQLAGQVINKDTKEPVDEADIQIMDADSDWRKVVTTDAAGNFGS